METKIEEKNLLDAINAHGQWKERLKAAIETGQSDFSPEKVKMDNNCDFGKWLYSLDGEVANSAFCVEAKDLHAQFHTAAAKVLSLALSGKKEEAKSMITDVSSEYLNISSKLVLALGRWKRSFNA